MVEGILIVALGALALFSLIAASRNQQDAERYRSLRPVWMVSQGLPGLRIITLHLTCLSNENTVDAILDEQIKRADKEAR